MHFHVSVRQWWRVLCSQREFAALERATIAELARDNAIPEAEFRRLGLRGDADPALLRRLLEREGIDPEKLARSAGSIMRDMAVVCSGCPMTRRCRHVLDHQGFTLSHESFCPNAETIAALRKHASADDVMAAKPSALKP